MKYVFVLLLMVSLSAMAGDCLKDRYGNVVCGKGECASDDHLNIFCAPVGGGAVMDPHGHVVCGVGKCAKDDHNEVWCSKTQGGGAAADDHMQVKCLDDCDRATSELCEAAK
jgi:hypothetical protein